MRDVLQRYEELSATHKALRLYALVDGYQYEQHTGERIECRTSVNRALFAGTEDEPLAHAGPWLYDVAALSPSEVSALSDLEDALPGVSWLITSVKLDGLAQMLRLKLDGRLPNGRKAIMRFYDPRVLGDLFHVMTTEQRAEFFQLIDEWHFMYKGGRVWTGFPNA